MSSSATCAGQLIPTAQQISVQLLRKPNQMPYPQLRPRATLFNLSSYKRRIQNKDQMLEDSRM